MNYSVDPKLGKILKEKGITQTQLSRMTGVPQSAISRFDKNKQHLDTHLIAISKALDLSIEDLFIIKEEGAGIPRASTEREGGEKGIPREDTERRFISIRNKVVHSTGDLTREDMEFISALYISQLEKGFYKENSDTGTSFSIPTLADHNENQNWNKIKVLQLNSKLEMEKTFLNNVELDHINIPYPKPPKRAEEINLYEIDSDEMMEEINKKKSKK